MTTTARPGRPRSHESARRRREFIRLIIHGHTFRQAAIEARVNPVRALVILDELEQARLIDVARGHRKAA